MKSPSSCVKGKKRKKIEEKRGKFLIDMCIAWDSSITRDKLLADRFQIMGKKAFSREKIKEKSEENPEKKKKNSRLTFAGVTTPHRFSYYET